MGRPNNTIVPIDSWQMLLFFFFEFSRLFSNFSLTKWNENSNYDFINALFKGNLTWEIYIRPPDLGCKYPTHTTFHLHKKLFRRQAWFAKLNATISWLGITFSSNPYDSTLFIHDIDKGITFFFFLELYVDDMVIIG